MRGSEGGEAGAPNLTVFPVESHGFCLATPSHPLPTPPPIPHPGKDTVIVAKVNGKELPGKPAIKWFKGKWLELGSKSGARFSFKESHDSASNVRTPWGRKGVWARDGGCAGQKERLFGLGQSTLGRSVSISRKVSGVRGAGPLGTKLV